MTDSERIARMERRQEMVIQAVGSLADAVNVTNTMLAELIVWLKEPPSTELQDNLKDLTSQVSGMRDDVNLLPERVARAVINGEL